MGGGGTENIPTEGNSGEVVAMVACWCCSTKLENAPRENLFLEVKNLRLPRD